MSVVTDKPVWLILPTYNEVQNLGPFIAAVNQRLSESVSDYTIVVVDDNSPDGTGKVAERMTLTYDRLQVLHRKSKDGLGRAYLAGFAVALEGGAQFVMEMDSDFSHDPRDIKRLLGPAAEGTDVVLGSRYVRGGGVRDWGVGRQLLSRAGCMYARKILGINVQDLTGGFKCFRRDALERIGLDRVVSNGYGFQIELTYRAIRQGLIVKEVPIVFTERQVGTSKMSGRIAIEAALRVPRLKKLVDSQTVSQAESKPVRIG